jgi:solute:Na+ symporter, SSS family
MSVHGGSGNLFIKIVAEDPGFKRNTDFGRDMTNITIATIAQTLLVLVPFYIILGRHLSLGITLVVMAICGILLKKFWYDNMVRQEKLYGGNRPEPTGV